MIKLYQTENERVYEKLESLLPAGSEIKKTKNGKPYTDGVYFSITHTGDVAMIAVSDRPVGVDAEIIKDRDFFSVSRRFSTVEQSEIGKSSSEFYKHWVVKEAYIKMFGGTLAYDLKRLDYFGGKLYCDGLNTDCNIFYCDSGDFIYCVCAESEIPNDLDFEII